MFSPRALTLRTVTVQPYGETAVAEFDREFEGAEHDGVVMLWDA